MNWRWQPRLRTTFRHIAGSASWWSLSMLIGVGLKQGAALCFGQKIWMDLEVSVGYTYTLTTHMTRDSFAQCNNGQRTESYRRRRWKSWSLLAVFHRRMWNQPRNSIIDICHLYAGRKNRHKNLRRLLWPTVVWWTNLMFTRCDNYPRISYVWGFQLNWIRSLPASRALVQEKNDGAY